MTFGLGLGWGGVQGGNNVVPASIPNEVDISDGPLDIDETRMIDERAIHFSC